MNDIHYVGIAEYRIIFGVGVLACSALGSCVAVCLWDAEASLSGMLHVLLPTAIAAKNQNNPLKFADSGISLLVSAMERRGADKRRLKAKITGGANLYLSDKPGTAMTIGEKNVEAVRLALGGLGIPVLAEHVGGVLGRSVKFDAESHVLSVAVLSGGTFCL